MKYLVDVYSMVDKVPVAVLRSARDGKVVMPLETADITRLEAEGWKAPEVFVGGQSIPTYPSCRPALWQQIPPERSNLQPPSE